MTTYFKNWMIFLMSLSGVLVFKPPLYDILLSATMIYWFATKRTTGVRRIGGPLICLLVYVSLYLLSVTRAVYIGKAVWYAGLTTFCALLWYFFRDVLTRYGIAAFHAIMRGYAITSVVGVVFGFVAYTTNLVDKQHFLYNGRPKGLFVDANIFGPSLIFVLLYSLSRVLIERRLRWSSLIWVGCAVLMAGGIFMSFSRGAWINAVLSTALFSVLVAISARSAGFVLHRFSILGVALLLVTGGVYFFFSDRTDFTSVAHHRSSLQQYDQERFQSHDNAVQVTIENPYLGIGPAQYIANFHIATHSLYLHVLAENGIFAFCGLMGFLALTIFNALQRIWASDAVEGRVYFSAVAAVLCASLVNSYVIDTLHWRHLWLLCSFAYMPAVRAAETDPRWALLWRARLALLSLLARKLASGELIGANPARKERLA